MIHIVFPLFLGILLQLLYFCDHNHTLQLMGTYINIGNIPFQSALNGEYIDKSELISVINTTLNTERRFSCVTRSRRFGKSLAAKMLCAYYDKSCDSSQMFSRLKISADPSFLTHLNKYRVIYLDMSKMLSIFSEREDIVACIQETVAKDIVENYPGIGIAPCRPFQDFLLRVAEKTGEQFIMIIDEWDAICRESRPESRAMDSYISWFRGMFKDVNATRIFAGVYLTGILPIKKYKTESALNNFTEYSMIMPGRLAGYFGFTKEEVHGLCARCDMDFDEMEKWYDGYQIGKRLSIFNPNSVMQALYNGECASYWAATGAYDNVAQYIRMNFDGLKDDILRMLAGGRCKVNTTSFSNDLSMIHCKDDVFTVLIHLGYLSYDGHTQECYIPNKEVGGEMVNAVNANGWDAVSKAIKDSEALLDATLAGDEETVAKGIESVHDQNTSILSYNNENSLSCVLSLAYYAARNSYIFHRELPTGKGFADIVLLPRRNVCLSAIILELKCDKNARSAISQIKAKNYQGIVTEYSGEIILVGVNYDRKTKRHTCKIEKCNLALSQHS